MMGLEFHHSLADWADHLEQQLKLTIEAADALIAQLAYDANIEALDDAECTLDCDPEDPDCEVCCIRKLFADWEKVRDS